MNTIKECFDTILRGDRNDSRLAARRVRKLIYSSQGSGNQYKDIRYIINSASQEYVKISELWRQKDFVVAVSVIYFLHNREKQPDFLFPWLFQLLLHPNGIIRYAVVRMIRHEIGPLTVHIRYPENRYKDETKEKRDNTILYSLFLDLNRLANTLWQPKYKRYKYIDSLPVSPYKSVQMILADLEDSCGEEYINNIVQNIKAQQEWEEEVGSFLKQNKET